MTATARQGIAPNESTSPATSPLTTIARPEGGHDRADQQREVAGAHPQRGAQLVAERPHHERATDQDEDSPGEDVREGPPALHLRKP